MLYSSFGLSIFMLIAIVFGIVILFRKLKYITAHNICIYLVLAAFWISMKIFSEQLSDQGHVLNNPIIAPLLVGLVSFVQVISRYILALFGAKIGSKKIPITVSFVVFMFMVIPFVIVQSSATFILLALGTGIFAGSFGMENVYFSENWSMHHVFISVALISFLPTTGIFVAKVIDGANWLDHNKDYDFDTVIRWILLAILIFSFVVTIFFVLFNRERKDIVTKDYYAVPSEVTKLGLKDLFKISVVILCFGMVNQLIFRPEIAKISDKDVWGLVYVVIAACSIISALVTALFLIQYLKAKTIVMISRFATAFAIVLGMIMWFANINSMAMGIVFIFIFALAVTTYETTMIGVMIHFDQKNKLMVFAIWLSIRSLGYAIGDTTAGILEAKYHTSTHDEVSKWIILAGFIIIVISLTTLYMPRVMAIAKKVYANSDRYENIKLNKDVRESIWK